MSSTDPSERPWPKRSRAATAGPAILVVVALVAIAAVTTFANRNERYVDIVSPTLEELRSYEKIGSLPTTYDEALKAGTVGDFDWGPNCDPERRYEDTDGTLARISIPSSYAPPCVPAWNGNKPWTGQDGKVRNSNGGSTAPGVSGDTIRVAFYRPSELDISRQLRQFGIQDSDELELQGIREIVEMNNHLYETYGRKVEIVPFQGTGDGRSPTSAKADAVKVAEMDVFASIGGPSQTTAYQHELARQGILCIGCGMAATDDVLNTDAPYSWGYLATPNQVLFGVLGYGANSLAHSKAEFAGTPEMRQKTRRFGVVHYEQDPPIYGKLKEDATKKGASRGAEAEVVIQYILDPNSLNAQAQAIIGRLKRERVTSVMFLGDPLMPRLLTQQATRQNYFPEWIFTGTAYTDMTSIGRLYDQRQMASAYGVSSAAIRTTPEASEAWQTYRWWYGKDPTATRTMVQWYPIVQMLYLGVHMAGPDLRAETFAGGMFRYPPTGGTDLTGKTGVDLFLGGYLQGDTSPRISFGFHNDMALADFVAVDDFGPIWWSTEEVGPDEGGNEGRGAWMYAGLGVRARLDNPVMPEGAGTNFLFKTKLTEADPVLGQTALDMLGEDVIIAAPVVSHVPSVNALPDYPIRKNAPAANK